MINHSGKVAVITIPNQQNQIDRLNGFQETIEKQFPNIELVAIKDGEGNQLVARQVASDILTEHPDLKGIFATEANGGVGVGEATLQLKKATKLKLLVLIQISKRWIW